MEMTRITLLRPAGLPWRWRDILCQACGYAPGTSDVSVACRRSRQDPRASDPDHCPS